MGCNQIDGSADALTVNPERKLGGGNNPGINISRSDDDCSPVSSLGELGLPRSQRAQSKRSKLQKQGTAQTTQTTSIACKCAAAAAASEPPPRSGISTAPAARAPGMLPIYSGVSQEKGPSVCRGASLHRAPRQRAGCLSPQQGETPPTIYPAKRAASRVWPLCAGRTGRNPLHVSGGRRGGRHMRLPSLGTSALQSFHQK